MTKKTSKHVVVPSKVNRKTNHNASLAIDKALESTVILIGHYYHEALRKYVNDEGVIATKMTPSGQGDDPTTVNPLDCLADDLGKVQKAMLYVNNIQRIRQDDSIDPKINPLS